MMIIVLLVALFVGFVDADVKTTSGILKGQRIETKNGIIHQYLGVPYAEPPLGKLRFRPPLDLTPSDAVYDATFHRASCMQPPHLYEFVSPPLRRNDTFIVNEDCLHLNIYAPDTASRLPIMVWLPGEGFDFADAQKYDGTYLALLGEVIVVTVNYRLSAFGFLSTQTREAPGNVGLLDQRMALQWVRDNIAAFGGDPERVTLFGTFTGAMSVSIQLASPLHEEEPLFQRAIIQGGVAAGRHTFEEDPYTAVKKLASLTGCDKTKNILKCLRRIPAQELLSASFSVDYRWRPTIDGRLVTTEPLVALKQKGTLNTDVLLGTNKDSGSLCFLSLYFTRSDALQEIVVNQLRERTLKSLIAEGLSDYYKGRYVTLEIVAYDKYRYLKESNGSLRDRYFEFCGDMYVKSSITAMARYLSDRNRVYVYQFDHRPSFSQHQPFFEAAHGDDTVFTFGLAYNYEKSTEEERQLSKTTAQAFANFARTGDPNSDSTHQSYRWPRYTSDDRAVLHFDIEMTEKSIERNADEGMFSFWEEVSPNLREKCF